MGWFSCFSCFSEEKPLVDNEKSPELFPLDFETRYSSIKGPQTSVVSSYVQGTEEVPKPQYEPTTEENDGSLNIHDVVPKLNPALVVSVRKSYSIINQYPYPTLEHENEVIISNRAVGLNPIDWKSVEFNFCLPEFPWITGREMSGVVEAIGAKVKEFKVGDRVWTSTYYKDRRAGCFQQYVTVPQHTVSHIPGNLDFESAACLGVAGLTAAMTLWRWLQVPTSLAAVLLTPNSTRYLLIWGGSTVTAQFAIQIAIQSGLLVIAVTSEKTKSLALRLGATRVVTRDKKTNDEIVAEIRELGGDNITRAIDLVGTETAKFCLKAMSSTKPGLFAPLAMISSKTVIPENITVETVEMKQFVLDPECRFYATELNRLVSEGRLVMPSIEVLNGGLYSIQSGLERLKSGDMAGKKMVVSMANNQTT